MDDELLEFEDYITDLYDFNLLDLLEDVDLDMQDLSKSEIAHILSE